VSKKWGWILEVGSEHVDFIEGNMYAGCPGYGLNPGDINYNEDACELVGTFSVNTGYNDLSSAGCTINVCDGVTVFDEHCHISTERPTANEMDQPGHYSYEAEGCFGGESCFIMVHIKVAIAGPIILCPV
jgi:hypothetical protein